MRITFLGHSGFRFEVGEDVLLVDPWVRGNPAFDEAMLDQAVQGARWVLLTHGHADHAADAVMIAEKTGAQIVGLYDLMQHFEAIHGATNTLGFNKGGTVRLGSMRATMVNAVHSSSYPGAERPVAVGSECGYMLEIDGRSIYFAGDTDVMADMGLFHELHAPTIGILPIGGHFTMDQRRAAHAAKKFFAFRTIIPCHYKTFPILAQNADELRAALPGVTIMELAVGEPTEL